MELSIQEVQPLPEKKREEKLAELIRGTNGEIAALRSGASMEYLDDVNPKKRILLPICGRTLV